MANNQRYINLVELFASEKIKDRFIKMLEMNSMAVIDEFTIDDIGDLQKFRNHENVYKLVNFRMYITIMIDKIYKSANI